MKELATKSILVVDDDHYLLSAIGQTLKLNGYQPELHNNPSAGLSALVGKTWLAVITDVRMPQIDGLELLERVQHYDADLPVIMITGHGDIDLAVQAVKKGAYDFLQKPVDEDILLGALKRAGEKRRLVLENRLMQKQLSEQRRQAYYRGMIGCHPLMNRLYDIIEMVAYEGDPVLLCGETGTGKELVAKAIHDAGPKNGEFIGLNMAAMPAELIESELFGHERGAFTGAEKEKVGIFEHVGEGTLFLDEICSMPTLLQAKLLRVLEAREFTRLGSNVKLPLQARIISATNRELGKEAAEGRFRADLFYRLNSLQIDIPPLRDRIEDLPLLAEYFRLEYCKERKRDIPPFSAALISEIQQQQWPGNIRELRNYIRRLCVFGSDAGKGEEESSFETDEQGNLTLKDYLEKRENSYIVQVLKEHNGRVAQAHKVLGLSRKGLYDKINKYNIELDDLRQN